MGFGWDDIGMSDPWEIAANIGSGGLYGMGKASYRAGKGIVDSTAAKNEFEAKPYDPDAKAFRFDHDGKYSDYMRAGASAASGRAAPTINRHQFERDRSLGMNARRDGTQARNMSLGSRAAHARYIDRLRQQSHGDGPSVAQNQLNTARDQNMRAALALAGSGRNSPGAYREAMSTNARLGQQAGRDAAALRAQEQMAAMNQLGAALQAQRGQDMQLRGQDQARRQIDQARAAQAAGMAQAQAQMDQRQIAMNDQARARYDQLLAQGYSQSQAAAIALEQLRAQQHMSAQRINAGVAQGNVDAEERNKDRWFNAAAAFGSSAMGSPG